MQQHASVVEWISDDLGTPVANAPEPAKRASTAYYLARALFLEKRQKDAVELVRRFLSDSRNSTFESRSPRIALAKVGLDASLEIGDADAAIFSGKLLCSLDPESCEDVKSAIAQKLSVSFDSDSPASVTSPIGAVEFLRENIRVRPIGGTIDRAFLSKKYTLIVFLSSACSPCHKSVVNLVKSTQSANLPAANFEIIIVAPSNDPIFDEVKGLALSLVESPEIREAMGIDEYPSVLFMKDNKVITRQTDLSSNAISALVDKVRSTLR